MSVTPYWGCSLCDRELPHDCEAERSLIALMVATELYARRIAPQLQTTDFLDPALRGAFASLRSRWAPYPPQAAAAHVDASESDPQSIERYIATVKARALQRRQIDTLARLVEQVYREPLLPRDFDWQVLNLPETATAPPAPEAQRPRSLVDLVVDPEDEAA